ncbi:MAG: hypothetical protein V7L19_29685 [Nostoc sp.]
MYQLLSDRIFPKLDAVCFIVVGIAIALPCVWLVKQKQYST